MNSERTTHTTSRLSIITRGDEEMVAVHPGLILKRELVARDLSANKIALALHVPSGRITSILNGKRAVTPETAVRLSRYFGNSAQFWMNLQTRYYRASARKANRVGGRARRLMGFGAVYPGMRCLAVEIGTT